MDDDADDEENEDDHDCDDEDEDDDADDEREEQDDDDHDCDDENNHDWDNGDEDDDANDKMGEMKVILIVTTEMSMMMPTRRSRMKMIMTMPRKTIAMTMTARMRPMLQHFSFFLHFRTDFLLLLPSAYTDSLHPIPCHISTRAYEGLTLLRFQILSMVFPP